MSATAIFPLRASGGVSPCPRSAVPCERGAYARTWLCAELKNRDHSEKILRILQEE
jgi:hypothetical protein